MPLEPGFVEYKDNVATPPFCSNDSHQCDTIVIQTDDLQWI
jgi:hypothetical protein